LKSFKLIFKQDVYIFKINISIDFYIVDVTNYRSYLDRMKFLDCPLIPILVVGIATS